MTDYIEYLTKDGDRLDLIARKAYGNAFDFSGILEANPTLPIQDVYLSGFKLLIPIQKKADSTVVASQLLPPWKR